MNKNTRTLVITVISFIVVLVVAGIAYNALKDTAPSVSIAPQLNAAAMTQAKAAEEPDTVESTVQAPPATTEGTGEASEVATAEPVPQTNAQAPSPTQEQTAATQPAEDPAHPRMPDIPLTKLDGTATTFDAVRSGKPAIINYFASWCPPCKEELPHFLKAYETYGDKIEFIFLDSLDGQRETLDTLNAFIKSFPMNGPVYYDDGMFAYLFQTQSIPTTVMFNADGTILKGYLGFISEDALLSDIEELLK